VEIKKQLDTEFYHQVERKRQLDMLLHLQVEWRKQRDIVFHQQVEMKKQLDTVSLSLNIHINPHSEEEFHLLEIGEELYQFTWDSGLKDTSQLLDMFIAYSFYNYKVCP
jgi:hypothetical protein